MTRIRTPTHKASACKAAKPVRRCARCPNRPLLSQCQHTKVGMAFLKQAAGLHPAPGTPTPTTSNIPEQLTSIAPTRESSLPPLSTLDTALPDTPTPTWQPAIDPILLATSHPTSSPLSDTPSDEENPSVRLRVTASHPVHGFVEGAKRGNTVYEILRPKALRPAIKDSRLAGKRFHRALRDIIARCENLSQETGCWLYLGAQHASAFAGFAHYASPRLRRDAKTQLSDIQQDINRMMAALVSSRRQEAMDLAMQLSQAQEEQRSALAEAESARCALEQVQSNTAEKDALIARLQSLVDSANA